VIREGTPYLRVMFAGNAVIVLLYVGNALVRGAGDGTIAMRALVIANGVNLVLVPCFVHGLGFLPKLGVTGAAWATTTLARGSALLFARGVEDEAGLSARSSARRFGSGSGRHVRAIVAFPHRNTE
jgi:Na+-driven multidrug efflux pump